MNFVISEMREVHIGEVVEIENACFSSPWTEENIRDELAGRNSHFLVAESDKVCGYIGVLEICGEAYITNIGVLPEYRRNGIAKSLLSAAIEGAKARNCEFITLEVRESNENAIHLYEYFKFRPLGKRKNFYSNPEEDGIIYTLNFAEGE